MFDFVHNNKRLVQIILALIAIPFALFGVDAYQRSTSTVDEVARVGAMKITRQELERSLQDQQDRMRQVLGRQFDASMFDTPAAREALVDQLVSQRLLSQYVVKGNLSVGDEELKRAISAMEPFQENGKFSVERYTMLLRAQNMSAAQFQESMRGDLALQRVNGALGESGIASKAIAQQLITLQTEKREVAEISFPAANYAKEVKLAPDAVETYYKANTKEFEVPARIRAEYVVLNQEMVAAQVPISAEDVRKAYDQNMGAKGKEREIARKKIDELLAEVKRSPDKFAELAKANSQDPGSAANGGDLGFFGRGMMVKAFDDTTFRLKPNEVSGIVESEFGFHIIRLSEIKAGEKGEERRASHILINAPPGVKPFEQARGEVEAELRKQAVGSKFAAEADRFQKLADQDQDSLKPFVEGFKLTAQTTDWLERNGANQNAGAIGNPKILDALFKPELIAGKRATEAIEAAPNVLVVARVLENKPTTQRTLDESRAEITKKLTEREALAMARRLGGERLTALRSDQNLQTKWGASKTVGREDSQGLSREAITAIFKIDAAKLPAFVGVDAGTTGYTVYRVGKSIQGELEAKRSTEMTEQLARFDSREQSRAFIAGLRERGKVEINRANLEKRAQQ